MTDPRKYRGVSSWAGLRRRIASCFDERLLAHKEWQLDNQDSPAVTDLRSALRTLPRRVPPMDLSVRLRIIASRESQRQKVRASWAARWNAVRQDLQLWANNLMRPLAIPTAGGFISASLMFGVLAPSLAIPAVSARTTNDIPTVLYTHASVKNFLPIGFEGNDDLVVEITVDENGKLVDYTIPNSLNGSTRLHRNIENQILFTEFTPATMMGQPMAGKVKITFVSSHIDVKG
jgi:hypothetical protein